ncbi:MAG: hypothetical protein KH438_09540 [Oscillibacter sp.]|nr:hypothetical protein [Oscillibacter sp.]
MNSFFSMVLRMKYINRWGLMRNTWNESLAERAALHDLMLKLLLVLVGVSVAYSALLCLAPETGWYSDVYPWAYQGLLDAVVFWR